jgi:hypothetical protein
LLALDWSFRLSGWGGGVPAKAGYQPHRRRTVLIGVGAAAPLRRHALSPSARRARGEPVVVATAGLGREMIRSAQAWVTRA